MKRLTTEEFIERAKLKYGDRFDYSKVEYKNNQTKVKIYCNKCKKYFWQRPDHHLDYTGCRECYRQSKISKNFIIRAQEIHGKDKYDYSKVEYKNNKTKVKIFCNTCKRYFWQTPNNHLHGYGCYICGNNKKGKKRIFKNDFIKRSIKIHGSKYSYFDINYKDINTKVKIYCNKCKKYFWQVPSMHLQGHGCSLCRDSKGEKNISRFLDNNKINYITQKRFKDCKDKRPLPFDFYLPNYNICIEYQGEQHYKSGIRFFKWITKSDTTALKYLEKLIYHDQIKRDYCKANNIQLIEIKYNENIEEKLSKILLLKK